MIRKIGLVLLIATLAALAAGESEPVPFPYGDVNLEPTVSIWVDAMTSIPVPWDAWRVIDAELCDEESYYRCYFVPDVGLEDVYFAVGRHLHSINARLVMESPELQLWDLAPLLPGSELTGFTLSREFRDGTVLRVQR